MIKQAFKALQAALKPDAQPVDKVSLGNAVVALQQPTRMDRELSPSAIGQALKAADQGNFADLMGLGLLLEDRDTQWRTVLQSRKLAVVKLPISVEAAGDDDRHQRDAELAREILAQSGIRRLLFDLLDGISKGFSVIEIEWATGAAKWMPQRFVYRDPRLFRTKSDAPDAILWTANAAGNLGLDPDAPLARGRTITHKPMLASIPAPQAGLCRLGVWLWMFKSFGIRDWVEFLEGFGQPLRVGKYPASATAAEKAVLRQAVLELGRAAGVIVPQGMELKLDGIGDSKAAPDLHLKLVSYFDQQASKLVLGQTTTTDAIGGGHAVSKEHNEVRGDIRDADAADLAETLERDLLRIAIDLNHGPPPDGLYPQIKIAEPESADISVLTTALKELVPLGLLVEQSVVRDRIGLPDPPEGVAPELLLRAPSRASDVLGASNAPGDTQSASGAAPPPVTIPGQKVAAQQMLALFNALPPPRDGIDTLAEDALADWEEQMAPLVGGLEDLLNDASSLEDARDRLAEAIQSMDITRLGNALAQSQFFARVAGDLGILPDPGAE